jgi:hypothetical protein
MTSPQRFYVEGDSTDGAGVGLDRADFSDAFGAAPSDDTTPSTWSGGYDPDKQDWGSDTITVTVFDRLENYDYENFYYIRDTVSPTVDVTCPAVSSVISWTVSWSGSDPPPASGLKHFDVQYKVESGGWQDWHTDTSLTEDTFGPTSPVPVQDDTTYYFRVRAEDNVSNTSLWTNGQDATLYHSGIKRVFLPIIMMGSDPNWGFETGDFASWEHGGVLHTAVTTDEHHSGSYSALLGDPGWDCEDGVPEGNAWMRRSVTVPSSGSPILRFWYKLYTQDKNTIPISEVYDFFAVYINGSPFWKDANTSDPYGCGTLKNLGWQLGTVSLTDYKGDPIQIAFYVYNRPDRWYNTYVYVDDVSVQY